MSTMNVICLIPEQLLGLLRQNPRLSYMFKNIDHNRYHHMMSEILGELMMEEYCFYSHSFIRNISREDCDAWMDCFQKALDQLAVPQDISMDLTKKMAKALEQMLMSPKICDVIAQTVLASSNPQSVIDEIRSKLVELERNKIR